MQQKSNQAKLPCKKSLIFLIGKQTHTPNRIEHVASLSTYGWKEKRLVQGTLEK